MAQFHHPPFSVFTGLTSFLTREPKSLSHRVRFLEHLNVGEPDHLNPQRFQRGRTLAVFCALRRLHMSGAIHFHGQTQLVAVEIQHIGLNRVLTAKLHAKLPATNQLPHHPFGVRLSSPQRACQRKQLGRNLLERRVFLTHVHPIGGSRPTSFQPGEISTNYRASAPDLRLSLDERERGPSAEMPRTTTPAVALPRMVPVFPLSPCRPLQNGPAPPTVRSLLLPLPVGEGWGEGLPRNQSRVTSQLRQKTRCQITRGDSVKFATPLALLTFL